MMMDDLWGVPPDTQGLYGQDFFYGAWLTDLDNLLELRRVHQQLLAAKKPKDYKIAEKRLAQREAVRETLRPKWPTWLVEAPAAACCQWCARPTRLYVLTPKASGFLLAGTTSSFTDAASWRHGGGQGLCPSCGFMVLSQSSKSGFAGMKHAAQIIQSAPETYRVLDHYAMPWWEWPWNAAPVLWTYTGAEAKTWSQRYWTHTTQPTWDAEVVSLWSQGQVWYLSGSGLRAMAVDARSQVETLRRAIAAEISSSDLRGLSSQFSTTAKKRWSRWLNLGDDGLDPLIKCFWIPTHKNLPTPVADSITTATTF